MNLSDLTLMKYEKGGRGPNTFDCFGLFREVCARRGLPVPDHPTPDDLEEREHAIATGISKGWVKLDKPEPFCGVAIRIAGLVCHIAVVLEDSVSFLHASKRKGVSIERIDSPMWQQRIDGFYRWNGNV